MNRNPIKGRFILYVLTPAKGDPEFLCFDVPEEQFPMYRACVKHLLAQSLESAQENFPTNGGWSGFMIGFACHEDRSRTQIDLEKMFRAVKMQELN
jgi:hypothetical protein